MTSCGCTAGSQIKEERIGRGVKDTEEWRWRSWSLKMKERAYEGPFFADAAKLVNPVITNVGVTFFVIISVQFVSHNNYRIFH